MQRQWQVRRRGQPSVDGARRWDRAYLLILSWSRVDGQPAASLPGASSSQPQEASHDGGGVCPGCLIARSTSSHDLPSPFELELYSAGLGVVFAVWREVSRTMVSGTGSHAVS